MKDLASLGQSRDLAYLRKQSGLSQNAVADRLGVNQQSVCRWEGRAIALNVRYIRPLSRLYGVPVGVVVDAAAESATTVSTAGRVILLLREERGWSREFIAAGLGIREDTVRRWETGYAHPSADSRDALADLFGMDRASLRHRLRGEKVGVRSGAEEAGNLELRRESREAQRIRRRAARAAREYAPDWSDPADA